MAFKDKLKDIFKPNWEAEPKNTSGASAGNSPTVQPAAATSSSDWNFDSLFTKPDGTPSSGTASGFKSLDSIFQPKDQAEIPEWKPEFDSQGFYKPTGKLSSRAYRRDIAAGNNYDAMGQNDKTFFSTYYQTLDNHTKLYTDLEDLTWGNTAENGKAFKSQYANGLKSLRDELNEVGRQYGINSNEYRALAQFKDDYFNLGRQISANYVDKDRRAMSQNLDDTIDTVLSGVVQAPDYQEKVEAGRKAIESNPTVYHRYKLGLEGASDKQRDLMYYIYANEGDKGAREFFDRVMGDTINYQKAAKDFTKDITTNDTKAARFWEANKANFAAAIDGQFGTGVRQLFTNTKADPDNRTIIKGYEISDSVDDFLRQQIALDEEELAIYGDDAFARLSSEVSADWVKEAAKDASDYQKGVLGYLYLAYKNPEASEALWEEIKGLDDEIWQMVNPGTVATAASSIEGGLYRDYLGLGSHKAPSWMGNPGEGEDKEDLAVAQAIWDFALTTRAQYPQMAGNILGALAGGPLVGQVLGSAIMSTSVYGNSYKESIEQGYSPKQAAAYGVSQAMSEFGTDMLLSGIAPYAGALTGNVGRTIVRRISNPFLQAVANLGIRSLGEGLQEYVQDIIDVPIRNIIFQENNKLNLADPGAVYSFFLGAMSAAAMSAPNISSEINVNKLHVQFGRALTKLDSTQKLVDTIINSKPAEGLTKEQRESYDKAVSIAKDLKAGRVNPNNRLVGEMFANAGEGKIDLSWLENPTTVDYNKDALTVEDMAAGARARLAELHGNVDLAQDLARYATGEQVTAEFMQALKDDPIAAQVFSELTGELDMENDKNALTIAARSTTRNNTGNKDYDTLKAENTTQTVASPAATTLFKAGVEFEEAQQIGAVIEKVANGQTITEDEAELIPVANSAMRQILSDTLGITIAEDATIGTVLQEMNNAAATMAETRSMQQEVANTAKQAAQARMPIPPNQQVDTTGTISIAGVEMNHDQFIENFMQKPGATLEQAEKAWANGRTVSAALNGEESTNGRRSPIPSNPERRNESVAAGGTVQEGTERGAETGRPVDTGAGREGGESQATGEELKRQLGYDPKHRVKRFNAEQRKFLLFCRDLGFNSIVLVKGKLNNEDGAPINAKFDPRTKQLTIRWDNPFKDINSVAMHEAIHLWLTETFGESAARYEYVNNALKDIFGEDTAAYDEMVKKYVEAYKKAYSGLDEATYLNYVNEEILADMYGGMENYGAKAGQYQQQAEMYVTQTNLREGDVERDYGGEEMLSLTDPFRNDEVNSSIPPEVRPLPGEEDAHPDLSMLSLTGVAEGGNFELRLNDDGQPYALIDKRTGEQVDHVTSEMMVDTPLGNIVNLAVEGGNITAAQAAKQYQMLADVMNLIVEYKDAAMVWEIAGAQLFSAMKWNADDQYTKTIDFSTICKKTMPIVAAMSEAMKQAGRGLTRREVEVIYEKVGKQKLPTPCPVCYVFARWIGVGGLLDQIRVFQEQYANDDEATLAAFMNEMEQKAWEIAEKKDKADYFKKGKPHTRDNMSIGKVLSYLKSGPNRRFSEATEVLSQHYQAVSLIEELKSKMPTADRATVKKWNELIEKLQASVLDEDQIKEQQAKMTQAEIDIEPYERYQWLAKTVMMKDGTKIGKNGESIQVWKKNPEYKPVPKDILFDLNAGAEFAKDYPLTWAFRTGKGCSAGKAMLPYTDARVGLTIQGAAVNDAAGLKNLRKGGLEELQKILEDPTLTKRQKSDKKKQLNEFLIGDVKRMNKTLQAGRKWMRRQNLIGGMRYQSTSDFRYEFGSDYLMTFLEMQALGANVQLYTKVIEAVDFLASTGADCNLSVMPLGDGYVEVGKDANGDPIYELRYSSVTGINKDAAVKKSREYDNVQLILVGINDLNIKLALEGTDVTFVIPFHGSGQSVHQVQTLMDLIGENLDVYNAKDYSDLQNDHVSPTQTKEQKAMWDLRMAIIMGKCAKGLDAQQQALLNKNPHLQKLYDMFYMAPADYQKKHGQSNELSYQNYLAKDQAQHIFPYEYWDKRLSYNQADQNGEIFKAYCESMGIIPRFSGRDSGGIDKGYGNFAYGGENGKAVKGYWKLLIDRSMYKNVYDEEGNWVGYGDYREQQTINMTDIDIGDLDPATGDAQFPNGEMTKRFDAERTLGDSALIYNAVGEAMREIEAMRSNGDTHDKAMVSKEFRDTLLQTKSELRKQANQTAEQAAPQERLSLADNSRILSDEEFDALTQQANEAGEGWTNAMRTRQELQNSEEAKAWVDKIRTNYSPETIAEYKAWEESSGLAEAARQERAFDTQYRELTEQVKTARKARDTAKVQKAAEEAGLSLPDYYRKLAEKEFGYTPYFYDAGYIVPNGKMLNFSGDKGKHYGVRGQDHRAIGAIFPDASGTKAMVQFMNQGNIRVMAESPGVDISTSAEPTDAQYKKIRDFIRSDVKDFFNVDFSDADGHTVANLEYDGAVRPDRVINDIKYYFQTGETRQQSTVSQFYSDRYSLALDEPGFETSNNEAPVTDERGQVLYVAPSSDAWAVARDTDGSLLNTEYIQNELGLPIYDNPHDEYAPEKRGAVIPKASDLKHKTANSSTEPSYVQAFDYLTRTGKQGARVLDASSGLGHGVEYGRSQGFDVTDLEPYSGGRPVDFRKYGGLIAAIENGEEEPFDFIISNAVINVMAQDAREELLANLLRMLKPGGELFINPAFAKEWDGYKKAISLEEYKRRVANGEDVSKTNVVMAPSTKTTGGEIYTAQSKSIQKGYTDPEFMAFAKDVAKQTLGEDIKIEKGSKLPGLNKGFVITRNGKAAPRQGANAPSAIQKRYSVMDQEHNDWAPTFYSKMANVISDWTGGNGKPLGAKMAANQVVGWLTGKGVKSEEIKWSGIVPFLEGKKTVTKEELQRVMAENEIKIETEMLDTEHWSKYTLPGGYDYREIIFKLPGLDYSNEAMNAHWGTNDVIAHARVSSMLSAGAPLAGDASVFFVEEIQSDLHNAGANGRFGEPTPEEEELKTLWEKSSDFNITDEEVTRLKELQAKYGGEDYQEYLRLDERRERETKRVKEIAGEIQDKLPDEYFFSTFHLTRWLLDHFKGIDYDLYVNGAKSKERSDIVKKLILSYLSNQDAATIRQANMTLFSYRDARDKYIRRINKELEVAPDVPFAGTTNTYPEYVMKQMIRMAAEQDYDKIGWTTAEQQIDRWKNEEQRGYKVFKQIYDEKLKSFMNKFAKQFGSNVGSTVLENGEEVWSVDITPEMKESVLHTGQPLFSMAEEQDTDERYSVNKKNPFPEGSAEQQMLDILTNANKAEDLQEYINKLIEKRNESIARSNYTPPSLPQNTLFPVNAKQKQAGTNQLQKLIDKYGALKKGEKPARDKNYPERTSDSRFTQRTARTAAEAASIPEYFADQIDQAVLSELLTYARITDQAALKVGDGDYNRLGYKNAIKEWNENRANTTRPSKYDIAFGERILVEAARNNDAAVAMKVLADLAAMATQSGQVVQAIRMLKDMGPVGQLYYIQKAVDRINKDNAGRIAKGTFPPITIDQAKAEAVILSNTKKEMDENMKVLIQSIADQIPVSLKDKWDAWRYFAMLGNVRTHGRNVLGNAIFAPVRFAKDLLAAAGESAFIKDPNERTKNAAAALKSQKYQDVREFALEDFDNMQQYIITGSKMNPLNEIMEARKIFNKGVVGKNFEKLRRWNDNMLNKEDTIFLRKAYVSAFSQFVAARGLTAAQLNGPKGGAVINEARQYAALEAQKATYRDFSRLASALNHLRRNSGMGLLLDGLLPFTKTPINILRRGVEYSPVGLMKGTFDALVKVRRGDITAAQAIDEMAAGLTGTGVALLGYILASAGLARGADDDDDKKKTIEEAEGHQKYSLEIGGISYTIDWMAPVALPFFVGVEAHKQLVGDGEGTFWDFCDAMTLLCEPMMSLSMLDGINSTLSAVKSSQNNAIWAVISNILASYVSQGAPTIAGQVARTFDPDRRSTYIDKNIEGPALLQRTIQGIQGKTPWANKKMAYVDVWGRKDTNSSFILRAAENLALPGYGNRINETPVDTELLRLYDSIGDNDVLPDTVAKYFQVEGERLNLTAKQYEQYKTVTGQTAFKMIGDLIDDPIYGKMDDTEKAAVVKSLLSAATAIGKKAVAPTYKMENWVDHAVAQDNLETAAIYRTLKAANTGLSNYQLISAMDWLTPEDRGKLIMEEHSNVDRAMTDPRRKKHKFILTDEQIAREREIYNSLFWPAYNELIYSQKFMNADIAGRASMIASMQTALGKQSRTQLSDELTAAGYTSAVQDDSDVPDQVTSLYDLLNRG